MSKSFLSSDWYRIAPLKPKLSQHVEITRQQFRNQTWYVIQGQQSGKYHRVSPAVNLMLCLMNGKRSMQHLWETACERFEDEPPTQSEAIQLLSQLHAADLISGDFPPNFEEMGRRFVKQERQMMLSKFKNPMALRFTLFDPEKFLAATFPIFKPLFTVWGFMAWLALTITALVLAAMNWAPLTESLTDRVLTVENGMLILIAYPLIKGLHELGHGYAVKAWGGEVHEIGLMFLIMMPMPYVDASAATSFIDKRQRAIVAAAGIMVEMTLASLALIFWLLAEQGIATAFAFNIMLIGGVSTLLFNGNPLLRFDGYFVLCDIIEIPNLGTRANKYFWSVVRRYFLKMRDEEEIAVNPGERGWFMSYAIAAFCYRVMISITIALFIASKLFFVGIALAIWALSNVFVFPVFKGIKFLLTSPRLRGKRRGTLSIVGLGVGAVLMLLFVVPVPYSTVAHGVVWLEEEAILRIGADGSVVSVISENTAVKSGDVIAVIDDPSLGSEEKLAMAQLEEIKIRKRASQAGDRMQVDLLEEQIRLLNARIEHILTRKQELILTSDRHGIVAIPRASDLIGQYLRKGDVLGYLLDDLPLTLRVAVGQDQAELVRSRTNAINFIFQRNIHLSHTASLKRAAPESQNALPSPALSTKAGGEFAIDPTDPNGNRSIQSVFTFDVMPDEAMSVDYVGERALVRFDHGAEPIGFRLYRALRQLFLSQFNV